MLYRARAMAARRILILPGHPDRDADPRTRRLAVIERPGARGA
jgi:hypothetical protein